MLVRLSNEDIARNWELFKGAIEASVPRTGETLPDRMAKCLEAALLGRIVCWLGFQGEEVCCAVVTLDSYDFLSGHSTVVVYACQFLTHMTREDIQAVWDTLRKYAKGQGCTTLTAYSDSMTVINLCLKANGGKGFLSHLVALPL